MMSGIMHGASAMSACLACMCDDGRIMQQPNGPPSVRHLLKHTAVRQQRDPTHSKPSLSSTCLQACLSHVMRPQTGSMLTPQQIKRREKSLLPETPHTLYIQEAMSAADVHADMAPCTIYKPCLTSAAAPNALPLPQALSSPKSVPLTGLHTHCFMRLMLQPP